MFVSISCKYISPALIPDVPLLRGIAFKRWRGYHDACWAQKIISTINKSFDYEQAFKLQSTCS